MTKNKRAMLIGAIGSGKSTLTKALLGYEPAAVKTQALVYHDWIVDTPGEYTENPMYYRTIMATSLEVTHVLFIQDATHETSIFPPGFSKGINKQPIGIITKADDPAADCERAFRLLRKVMPKGPVVVTSAFEGTGTDLVKALVFAASEEETEALMNQADQKM